MSIPRWSIGLISIVMVSAGVSMFLAVKANAQTCPNEILRSELKSSLLPDCRAYELVTPVYKEGQLADNAFALSSDGSRMLVASLGAFAGAEEDRLGDLGLAGDVYELSRTETGWVASARGPPAWKYQSNGMYDASADLSSSLWELGSHSPATEAQPEEVTDFYIEQSPGLFSEIGPATPYADGINLNRYTYLGGSGDLSHIIFSTVPGFHWPFDKTEGSPLYEYVGTGNSEPRLVGANGGAESKELVSDCETRLGSINPYGFVGHTGGSTYNAVSYSGDRIFFTAVACGERPSVDEIFAREELSSGELRTVPISEPSISYCLSSPLPPCAAAHFEGASQDGSKVFFTSTQKLLPGASEESANLYEDELGGSGGSLTQKLILVSGPSTEPGGTKVQGVARISEDGSHVYFVAHGRLTGTEINNIGYAAQSELDNLYVFTEGHIHFIATLSPNDEEADWQQEDDRQDSSSWDGRLLVFTSVADITHENVEPGRPQVYQYDADTGNLVRASIGQMGYNNDGRTPFYGSEIRNALPAAYRYSFADSPTQVTGVLAPEDGAVFFQSPDALTPQALSDQLDGRGEPEPNIYEYHDGKVYLISDGRDTSTLSTQPSVQLIGSSASGGDLFFTTSDSLIGGDSDTQQDIYDAHVGGGFAPSSNPPVCAEDICHGAPSQPPVLPQALATPMSEAVLAPTTNSTKKKTGDRKVRKPRRKKMVRKKKKGEKPSKGEKSSRRRAR